MGDQVRMVVMDAVIKEIFRESLLDYVVESGRTLLTGLKELEVNNHSPSPCSYREIYLHPGSHEYV